MSKSDEPREPRDDELRETELDGVQGGIVVVPIIPIRIPI